MLLEQQQFRHGFSRSGRASPCHAISRRENWLSIILLTIQRGYTWSRETSDTMPYCPDCLTEYIDGTEKCEDCGMKLAPGCPPKRMPVPATGADKSRAIGKFFRSLVGVGERDNAPEVKTVTVRTFHGPTATLDAELARNVLEAQGIPTILPGENSVELLPFLEVSLLVDEEDLPRATQILKHYFDTPGPGIPE